VHAALQLDREKQAEAVLQELASIIARYRGPLLESSVDLEQRLWHLATMTGEVSSENSSSSNSSAVGTAAVGAALNEWLRELQCVTLAQLQQR
jgi:hypothetical protein